jgi:hypothetical protein
VRGRGVDHLDAVALDQADGLARRIVRQAEDYGVSAVEQLTPRLDVLAALRVDRDELQIAPAGEPLADLEAGGAGLAIDEHLGRHDRLQSTVKWKGALR